MNVHLCVSTKTDVVVGIVIWHGVNSLHHDVYLYINRQIEACVSLIQSSQIAFWQLTSEMQKELPTG